MTDSSDEEIIDILLPVAELRAEVERLRAALELVKDWSAVGELTDSKMAQIQQALERPNC
jgi:hypothetical protein